MRLCISSDGTEAGTWVETGEEGKGKRVPGDDYLVAIAANGDYPDVSVHFIAGELLPLNWVGFRVHKGRRDQVVTHYHAFGEEAGSSEDPEEVWR